MTTDVIFKEKVTELIDNLKAICASAGLGNDGNEFKIITQVFLYKFLNDKFAYEAKKLEPRLAQAKKWEEEIKKYSEDEYEMLLLRLGPNTAKLKPEHLISSLYSRQNNDEFAKLFDDTLINIGALNSQIFSVNTEGGAKITLFNEVSNFISDSNKRDAFCRAVINKLVDFSFESIFAENYDFFATIFEYLIKDYNKDSGGKYAEYYTPHAVSRIIASILVDEGTKNVSCYDPSAGSGTLLMNLANAIGTQKCSIYSQDISQKSSGLLRLNLILNDLVHSIPNVIQGNTITAPYHKENGKLKKFDFIVANPPFKLDFSEDRDDLDTAINNERFFAGVPKTPKKAKDKMAIYLLFIQHIMHSLTKNGRAAIVVPTGFVTAQSGIDKKIRERMIEQKMISGVVSMPSNIFATTGTNVSIIFLDKNNTTGKVVLIDASGLGVMVKEEKTQKTVLSSVEEQQIIDTFRNQTAVDDFSVVVDFAEVKRKNCSFSAGQYFEIKIEYTDISAKQFESRIKNHEENLDLLFKSSNEIESEIKSNFLKLDFNDTLLQI